MPTRPSSSGTTNKDMQVLVEEGVQPNKDAGFRLAEEN
jgi:hypothetical protein